MQCSFQNFKHYGQCRKEEKYGEEKEKSSIYRQIFPFSSESSTTEEPKSSKDIILCHLTEASHMMDDLLLLKMLLTTKVRVCCVNHHLRINFLHSI